MITENYSITPLDGSITPDYASQVCSTYAVTYLCDDNNHNPSAFTEAQNIQNVAVNFFTSPTAHPVSKEEALGAFLEKISNIASIGFEEAESLQNSPSTLPFSRVDLIDNKYATFDMFGKPILTEKVKKIGKGFFKKVTQESIAKNRFQEDDEQEKVGKHVAVSHVNRGRYVNCSDALSIYQELKVGSLIGAISKESKHTIKVHYIGMNFGQLKIITKFANKGVATNILPTLNHEEKLKELAQVAHSLAELHDNDIIHNDIAIRNVLVHASKNEEALKFYLTDFGMSTMTSDNVHPFIPLAIAPDITSPERYAALVQLAGHQSQRNSEGAREAAQAVQACTSRASDIFSLGVCLCDAILRPELKTDLGEKIDETYEKLFKTRRLEWQNRLLNKSVNTDSNKEDESYLPAQDHAALEGINPALAELVKGMMAIDPARRPDARTVALRLEEISRSQTLN